MTITTSVPRSADAATQAGGPLGRLLAAVRRRTRWWVWVESLAWIAVAAAALFWGTLLVDWLVEPPAWARFAAVVAGGAGLAWIIWAKLADRLAAPLSDASLALLVERCVPRCGDSLTTAVALADREARAADGEAALFATDPELATRTRAAADALAVTVDPATLFRSRRLAAWAVAGVAAVASVVTLTAARGDIAGLWVRRMTLLADEPWPRRVTLAVEGFTEGRRLVARGSAAEIVVHAQAAAGPPEVVELRMRGADGWRSQRMGTRGGVRPAGQTFVHTLERVVGDLELEIRGGDARLRDLRLVVAEPPALAGIEIEYEPPAYLGSGSRPAAAARVIRIPRGARVRLACRSTKPLSAARLVAHAAGSTASGRGVRVDGDGGRPDAAGGGAMAGGDAAVPRVVAELATPSGGARANELIADLPSLDADLAVALELTDVTGLHNLEPIEFLLSAVADERPQVMLTPRGAPAAITPAGRLLLAGSLADDHGLAEADVELDVAVTPGSTGMPATPATAEGGAAPLRLPIPLATAAAPLVEFTPERPHVVELAPHALAPGSRVSFTATARDGCTLEGGPNEGRGETWTLDVVTPDALRALLDAREILLRRRFESAIDDMAQARARLAAPDAADGEVDPAVACAEAAARTAGEAADIAESFRGIRLELDANDMLSPEVDERLVAQIADPLASLATRDLPALDRACRTVPVSEAGARADVVLARLRAVLARMIELESYNQLVERLRDVIRLQEQIRTDTLEEQKRRGRAALGLP